MTKEKNMSNEELHMRATSKATMPGLDRFRAAAEILERAGAPLDRWARARVAQNLEIEEFASGFIEKAEA